MPQMGISIFVFGTRPRGNDGAHRHGQSPMVGATVAVSVAVYEACK